MPNTKPTFACLAVAGVLGALVAGCTSPSAPAPGQEAGGGDQLVRPKVNRVVFALETGVEGGNDPSVAAQAGLIIMGPMHEHLVWPNPQTGLLEPQLATEWKLEPGPEPAYRFTVRQGVRFHRDFGEMTTEDVIWSYKNRISGETASPSQTAITTRTLVKDARAVSDREVLVTLTAPDPRFLSIVAMGWEVISKKNSDAVGGKVPGMQDPPIAGTGPYQMVSRAQGQYGRFERVPYQHWRIMPDFPEFEWRIINEESTRLAALLAREVHLAELGFHNEGAAAAAGMKAVAARAKQNRIFFSFWCCYLKDGKYVTPDTPLLDARVRRALNKAINRDELNRAFFAGKGQPLYHPVFTESDPYFKREWKDRFAREYGFNMEEARALLRDAGFDGSARKLPVKPVFNNRFPGADNVTEAVMGYWRTLGADVEGLTHDSAVMRNMQRNNIYTHSLGLLDSTIEPFTSMASYFSPYTARLGMDLPEAVALFDRISKTLDEKELATLVPQWGDVIYNQFASIPLLAVPLEVTLNPDIVADYVFPGNIIGYYSHVEHIKAAR